MSQRVLSTDRAKSAAQQLNSLLTGSLKAQLAALKLHGQTLCSPAVWDGPAAARFRSQQWPPLGRSMDQALQALANLEKSAQTVVDSIMRAGSQGSMGGTITGVTAGSTVQNAGERVIPPGWPGFLSWQWAEAVGTPPTCPGSESCDAPGPAFRSMPVTFHERLASAIQR